MFSNWCSFVCVSFTCPIQCHTIPKNLNIIKWCDLWNTSVCTVVTSGDRKTVRHKSYKLSFKGWILRIAKVNSIYRVHPYIHNRDLSIYWLQGCIVFTGCTHILIIKVGCITGCTHILIIKVDCICRVHPYIDYKGVLYLQGSPIYWLQGCIVLQDHRIAYVSFLYRMHPFIYILIIKVGCIYRVQPYIHKRGLSIYWLHGCIVFTGCTHILITRVYCILQGAPIYWL